MQDLLFLSQRIPYPPNKGDKTRSFHFLRHLASRYRVHLGCFIDDPADWQHLPALRKMVHEVCARPINRRLRTVASLRGVLTNQALSLPFYYDRQLAQWVKRTVGEARPAVAFLYSSPMAQYLLAGVPRPPRVVMDFVDVDSQKWQQYAANRSGPSAAIYRREARRLLAFEQEVAAFADASLFVTGPERDLFAGLAPEQSPRLHVVENGVDTAYFAPEPGFPCPFDGPGPVLVFTGAMDYWPNIDAVGWFARDVLPLVRQQVADARFVIVGANPAAEVLALANAPAVQVTGRVADVRPYIAHAAAVVAPLRTARGVQNKVLEGMAMARPVVATRQAHEGIDASDGAHLIVCDDAPSAFAAAVLAALTSPPQRIGAAARQRILERYAWEARFKELDDILGTAPNLPQPALA